VRRRYGESRPCTDLGRKERERERGEGREGERETEKKEARAVSAKDLTVHAESCYTGISMPAPGCATLTDAFFVRASFHYDRRETGEAQGVGGDFFFGRTVIAER